MTADVQAAAYRAAKQQAEELACERDRIREDMELEVNELRIRLSTLQAKLDVQAEQRFDLQARLRETEDALRLKTEEAERLHARLARLGFTTIFA